jgi:TPR repeat protein
MAHDKRFDKNRLIDLISQGDSTAASSLASLYYHGYDGPNGPSYPKDRAEAFKWHQKAVELDPNNSYALYFLAKIYDSGDGTTMDKEASTIYYQKCVDSDPYDVFKRLANEALALKYFLGDGVSKDLAESFKKFLFPATANVKSCLDTLGLHRQTRRKMNPSQEAILNWLISYDMNPKKPPMNRFNIVWENHLQKKGMIEALKWFIAEFEGDGPPVPDKWLDLPPSAELIGPNGSMSWYLLAVHGGNPKASREVGVMRDLGRAFQQDKSAARDLFERAAKAGEKRAIKRLESLAEV